MILTRIGAITDNCYYLSHKNTIPSFKNYAGPVRVQLKIIKPLAPMLSFQYGHDHLTPGIALELVSGKRTGVLSSDTRSTIRQNRKVIESIVRDRKIVYGINTGFGSLCTTIISEEDTRKLQYNLLLSHSVGVGDPVQL